MKPIMYQKIGIHLKTHNLSYLNTIYPGCMDDEEIKILNKQNIHTNVRMCTSHIKTCYSGPNTANTALPYNE